MPSERSLRENLRLIESQSLSLVVNEMLQQSQSGRMITHAMDSTTKKRAGQFVTQGIHIGQNCPFPLPLINICGEKTEDIALQVDFGFRCLAAVKDMEVAEIYSLVDAHQTDSVEHNKGFAKELQELYDLDSPAGQLFCGSHTTLGFSSAMNKIVSRLELDMNINSILSKFMVEIDVNTKHGSVAGHSLDCMLKLVAPEYSHKNWNYFGLYTNYLKLKQVDNVLFSYKDQRFGCLSRASAVLLYNWDHLQSFLDSNPQINNRLACLVRELLQLPYLKVIYSVFAGIGIHIIEPFFSRTMEKGATHTSLKKFYMDLHEDLGKSVTSDFFTFNEAEFRGVSIDLFEGVKESYSKTVVDNLVYVAEETIGDAVTLVNLIMPELKTVLARQRRDYNLSDEFPAQYPIEDQATNIDDTPVHNLAMERQCGTVDYRLPKLQKLSAVSRSMILGKTKELRKGDLSSFRSFKKETEKRMNIELEWKKEMKAKFAAGADSKQVIAQTKERKRLDMMDKLKALGGPFTNADNVEDYLTSELHTKEKQARLKLEIQFARESSTTLPSVDQLFKIQVTMPNKKRRDKNAEEFGEALKTFLGKKSDQADMDYKLFKESLNKFANFIG